MTKDEDRSCKRIIYLVEAPSWYFEVAMEMVLLEVIFHSYYQITKGYFIVIPLPLDLT